MILQALSEILMVDFSIESRKRTVINYSVDNTLKAVIVEELYSSGSSAPVVTLIDLESKISDTIPSNIDRDEEISERKKYMLYKGEFYTPYIEPGTYVIYRLYLFKVEIEINSIQQLQQNIIGVRHINSVNLMVNCISVQSDFGVKDTYKDIGGTYIYFNTFITKPSIVKAYICKGVQMESNGFAIPNEVVKFGEYNSPHQMFTNSFSNNLQLEFTPLLAGNDYFLLIYFFGQKGEWYCLPLSFVTKQRYLEFKIESFKINNNGGRNGGEENAELSIELSVEDGDERRIQKFEYPVLPKSEKNIAINWHVDFGPKTLKENILWGLPPDIKISTYGEEDDSFWFISSKEQAVNSNFSGEILRIPNGRGKELVNRSPISFFALPVEEGDNLNFESHGWFSVNYI